MARGWGERLAEPLSKGFVDALAYASVFTLWFASGWTGMGEHLLLLMTVCFWVPATGVLWGRFACARWGVLGRVRWRYAAAAAIVTTTLVLVTMAVPQRVAYAASESALERAAVRVASSGTAEGSQRLGWIKVESITPIPGGARFSIGGITTPKGRAWHPGGPPPDDDERCISYEHIRGPWYRWTTCYSGDFSARIPALAAETSAKTRRLLGS